jgi:hypothetical protein
MLRMKKINKSNIPFQSVESSLLYLYGQEDWTYFKENPIVPDGTPT